MPRPSLTRLRRAVGLWLSRVGRDAAVQVARRPWAAPDLSRWIAPMAEGLAPLLSPWFEAGGNRTARRLTALLAGGESKGHFVPLIGAAATKGIKPVADGKKPRRVLFTLLHPRVAEALRRMVFNFAESTLATARDDVVTAQRKLREELTEGLAEGEGLAKLTVRVREIFDDPNRSYVIARTESARAVEHGGLIAAQESGVVSKKRWIAAPGCCDRCKALDGVEKRLHEPFVILPGGGPYAVVMTGGTLHPQDRCTTAYILAERWKPRRGKVTYG